MTVQNLESQLVGSSSAILPWLQKEEVTDILINGTQQAFIEQQGQLEAIMPPFKTDDSLFHFIERLLLPLGKRVDATQPYLDGRLMDGSRFHLILPPLAIHGPFISIRKARQADKVPLESFGPEKVLDLLKGWVSQRKNILIAGGTGTGKTTLLSRLLETVPSSERILIVEETQELRVRHPHAISLEGRSSTPEGTGEVSLRTLVRNALRMRPDRIVLGECRGGEALDMLQAMNTGHGGSLGTLHANSAWDALRRFETLCLFSGIEVPIKVVREWVGNNIHGVVYLQKHQGIRSISEVLAVSGLEGEVYRITPCYRRVDAPQPR